MTNFLTTTAEDNISEQELSDSLIKGLVKHSGEAIAITDNNFRILYANRPFFKKGENLFSKLKLKKQHINTTTFGIKRSMIVNKSICLFSLDIIRMNGNNYIFFARENGVQKDVNSANATLITYLKHDLKTHIISQIMALKVLLKKGNTDNLLDEIINSTEISCRMLQNHINEFEYQDNNLTVTRKEISIKPLFDEIKKECENFIKEKKNVIKYTDIRNSKIYADSVKLKDALVNILQYINKLTEYPSEIYISADISHGMFKITVQFPCGNLGKDIFSAPPSNKNMFYTRSNCLHISGKIIELHGGKIRIENKGNKSLLKIYMPK